jgi:hypothetical protein
MNIDRGNGQAAGPDALRRQAEHERALADLALARYERSLMESFVAPAGMGGGWSDISNPFGYRLDDAGRLWLPLGGGTLFARQHGRNRPFAWMDINLDEQRSLARWLAARNQFAAGALRCLTNFVIKKGFQYEARPAAGFEGDPEVVRLARDCQRVIDRHDDVNRAAERERSVYLRSVRDGEAFVRHFAQPDGTTLIRAVEPEQVREQAPAGHDADGAFGVVTAPGDIEDVRAYVVTYDGSNYELVDASEVSHIKRNVDETVKRGLSDFYAAGETLDAVSRLVRNMTASGSVQSAIAWIEQFENSTASQVGSYLAGVRDLNRPQLTHPVTGREVQYQRYEPGTIVRVGAGKQYVPPPLASNTSNHVAIVQAALRSAAAVWNMPEYMISADASNNNFASVLVAGAPFVNFVECEQARYSLYFLRWRWVALRNACAAGLLGPVSFELLQRLIDVSVTTPQVAVAKEAEQASIDHQDIAAGVMSLQTRRARRGLDDEQERKNLQDEPPTRVQGRVTDLDAQGNPRGQGGSPDQPSPAPPGSADDPFAAMLGESRREGEVWQGDSGRWFTVKGGRVVPARARGGEGGHDAGGLGGKDSAAPEAPASPAAKAEAEALKAAGGRVGAVKAAAARLGGAVWSSMSEDEQWVAARAYAVGKWVLHRAETGLRKGNQWAVESARARGLSDEQATKVGKVLGVIDTVAAWTVNVPAATLATGNPLVGKAAGLFPVASAAYLAYSAARDPLAVVKAAWKTLRTPSGGHHESAGRPGHEAVIDGFVRAGDAGRDWYAALVMAAADLAGGDHARAAAMADEAFEANPSPPAAAVKESRDASGHEHDDRGRFTSSSGGSASGGGEGKDGDKAVARAEHGKRAAARRSRRDAVASKRAALNSHEPDMAGDAAGLYQAASDPDPEKSLAASEAFAKAAPEAFAAGAGRAVEALKKAGAPERHLSRVERAAERGKASLARASARLAAAVAKEKTAHAAWLEAKKAHDESEAAEPDAGESEVDKLMAAEPGIDTDDPRMAEAEAADEKGQAAWEKAHEKWEKAHDKLSDKLSKAEEKLGDAQSASGEAADALDSAHADASAAVEDAYAEAADAASGLHDAEEDAIDAEEESDPEPEEDEENVEESLTGAAAKRKEGETWRGPSGRWFTIKSGRVVPTRAPDAGGAKAGPGAKAQPKPGCSRGPGP